MSADEFCQAEAPPALRQAVRDMDRMKLWAEQASVEDLTGAMKWIHAHHIPQRDVVRIELESRRHQAASARAVEAAAQTERQHAERQELGERALTISRRSVVVAIISALVALASYASGRLWPVEDQDLKRRVQVLEQRVASLSAPSPAAPAASTPTPAPAAPPATATSSSP